MKRLLFGLAALPFLAGVSLAAQPVPLSDTQMDRVTAGFDFESLELHNLGVALVEINGPALVTCRLAGCFLQIDGTQFPGGTQSFQLQAQFGPLP